MPKNKRPGRKPDASAPPPPTRFVRRRRPARKRKSEASEPAVGARSADMPAAAIDNDPELFGAAYVQRWGKAPRPAEAPPRNPNVFSYTYRVWKTS